MGVSAFKSRTQTVTRSMTVSDITLIDIDYEAVVATDLPVMLHGNYAEHPTMNLCAMSERRWRCPLPISKPY